MISLPVENAMSTPVRTVSADLPVAAAAREMCETDAGSLVVVADGALVGIVTTTDLTHDLPRLRNTILRERAEREWSTRDGEGNWASTTTSQPSESHFLLGFCF